MGRSDPTLAGRWRAWLGARWQRRWRLTRRGRLLFGSLGVLLLLVISSLVGSWARDAPPAKGLPATTSRPEEPSGRAARATSRGFTLIASGDVLTHGAVLERARAYGRRRNQPYDFRPMFASIRPIVSRADLAVCHLEVPLSRNGQDISSWPAFNAPRSWRRRCAGPAMTPARPPPTTPWTRAPRSCRHLGGHGRGRAWPSRHGP